MRSAVLLFSFNCHSYGVVLTALDLICKKIQFARGDEMSIAPDLFRRRYQWRWSNDDGLHLVTWGEAYGVASTRGA
jgi:hypothetical protein